MTVLRERKPPPRRLTSTKSDNIKTSYSTQLKYVT